MKKHDEGYVMILVVVVMAVLMIVSLSLMALGLRNARSQAASVERMRDKYSAQGEVEKTVAIMEANLTAEPETEDTSETEFKYASAEEAVEAWLADRLRISEESITVSIPETEDTEKSYSVTLAMTALSEQKTTQITYELVISGTVEKIEEEENETENPSEPAGQSEFDDSAEYKVTFSDLTYDSYQISTVETTSEDGGDGQ